MKKFFWFGLGVVVSFVFFATPLLGLAKEYNQGKISALSMVRYVNEDRTEEGLSPLKVNELLQSAAQQKAEDMVSAGYFAHNTPDGRTPWFWIQKVGYKFVHAGENLAVGFSSSKEAEKALMRSPSHRANILSPKYTDVGIGLANGVYKGQKTVYIVELFGAS